MLRRIIYGILGALLCTLAAVGIDTWLRVQALERMEKREVNFGHWCYRVVGGDAHSPDELRFWGPWYVWRQRVIARPDMVILTQKPLDAQMLRDLATTRMAEVCLQGCEGLTPAVMGELYGITALRGLDINGGDLTDEGLNPVWTRVPDLGFVSVDCRLLTEKGFRDIGQARKLVRLDLRGKWKALDPVIARVAEAPALQRLVIEDGETMEACAEQLAGMPALKEIQWIYGQPHAPFIARLKALKPGLKLISIWEKEM